MERYYISIATVLSVHLSFIYMLLPVNSNINENHFDNRQANLVDFPPENGLVSSNDDNKLITINNYLLLKSSI